MLLTALALLLVAVGVGILDHLGITPGAARSVGLILVFPIVLLIGVWIRTFVRRHHLWHRH
jgi:hypothetical protein